MFDTQRDQLDFRGLVIRATSLRIFAGERETVEEKCGHNAHFIVTLVVEMQ